jgi:hypothetical protein
METLLLSVTVVSLVLGVGVSVIAWRLLRADRQRSAARVEALHLLADEGDDVEPAPGRGAPAVSHAPSRYATIDEGDFDVEHQVWDVEPEADALATSLRPTHAAVALVSDHMFGATAAHGGSNRRWLTLVSVTLVMAAGAGLTYALHARTSSGAGIGRESASTLPSSTRSPVALVSLTYAADPDGTFTVTGLVQNPATGGLIRGALAVVYLFDRDGNYFATGRAALDAAALQPGDESPFVVHVPNVGQVSRYRVGFRLPDGGVLAHVDRRGQPPDGITDEELPAGTSAARAKGASGSQAPLGQVK